VTHIQYHHTQKQLESLLGSNDREVDCDLEVWVDLIAWHRHLVFRPSAPDSDTDSEDCFEWRWSWQKSLGSRDRAETQPECTTHITHQSHL